MGEPIGGADISPCIDEIAPALVAAINAIHAVKKDNQSPGVKYRFADLADCIAEAKRALGDNGMTVMQPLSLRNATAIRGGELVETAVSVVRTIVMHKSGQWIASDAIVPDGGGAPAMSATQVVGSNITYMKRYALCAMLCIPTEDDDGRGGRFNGHDDRRNERREPERRPEPPRPSLAYRGASIEPNVKGAAAEWDAHAKAEGIDEPLGLTVAAVESALIDKAIATGKTTGDRFDRDGKRDHVRVSAYLASMFERAPDRFEAAVVNIVSASIADRKAAFERETVDV